MTEPAAPAPLGALQSLAPARLRAALLAMAGDEKGRMALADVGIDHFEPVEREEVEFMIDLMVALTA